MTKSLLERCLELPVRMAQRRPFTVLATMAVLTLLGAALGSRVTVSTSQRALIPADHPVEAEYLRFAEEFGATESLIIVLEGAPEDLRRAAPPIAAALRAEAKWVRSVFYRIDVDELIAQAPLYASVDELGRARDMVQANAGAIAAAMQLRSLTELLAKIDEAFAAPPANVGPEAATSGLGAIAAFLDEWRRFVEDPAKKELALGSLVSERTPGAAKDILASSGFLTADGGKLLILFAQPTESSDESEFLRPFLAAARGAVDKGLAEAGLAGRVTYGLTGMPAHVLTEADTVFTDVGQGGLLAVLLVVIIVLIGFRTPRKVALAVIPLISGMVLSVGIVTLLLGRLSLISAAFVAVMFGMSIDFGIYLVRRAEEELAAGATLAEAIRVALTRTGAGVLAGGLTTAAAFFAITFSEFTGFIELGLTAGIGTLVCLASVFILFPALAMKMGLEARKPNLERVQEVSARRSMRVVKWAALAVGLAVLAGGALAATRLRFDYDALNLLPRDTESTRYQRVLQERTQFQVSALFVVADTLEEMRVVSERLAALPEVRRVESLSSIIPEKQEEKAELTRAALAPLRDVLMPASIAAQGGAAKETTEAQRNLTGSSLTRPGQAVADSRDPRLASDASTARADGEQVAREVAVLNRLTTRLEDAQEAAFSGGRSDLLEPLEKAREAASRLASALTSAAGNDAALRTQAFEQALLRGGTQAIGIARRWLEVQPLREADLAPELLARFKSSKGHYVAYVFPRDSIWDVAALDQFMAKVRAITPRVTGFPATHQAYSRIVVRGFTQAMLYASIVMVLILALSFRRAVAVGLVLVPLALAVAGLQILLWALKVEYNYADIAAFPVLMGYGVAYGVNIVQRWLEAPEKTAFVAAMTIGKGVLLSAVTTLAGIGSVIGARHRGVSTFGLILLIGIALCFVTAVFVLPAVIDTFFLKKRKAGT